MTKQPSILNAIRTIVSEEIRSTEDRLDAKITDFKSEILTHVDSVHKEVKLMREEQIVLGHRVDTHDKRLNRVENELRLEPISEAL